MRACRPRLGRWRQEGRACWASFSLKSKQNGDRARGWVQCPALKEYSERSQRCPVSADPAPAGERRPVLLAQERGAAGSPHGDAQDLVAPWLPVDSWLGARARLELRGPRGAYPAGRLGGRGLSAGTRVPGEGQKGHLRLEEVGTWPTACLEAQLLRLGCGWCAGSVRQAVGPW